VSLLETVVVSCPYCGEPNELVIDTTVSQQEYVEDCAVCCRPMVVVTEIDADGAAHVQVRGEDEA
jgi:hypothetical protein